MDTRRHADPSARAEQHVAQAQAYKEKNELLMALQECEAAIQLAPGRADAHFLRGVLCERLGRGGDSLAAYKEAVRLDPDLKQAWDNLFEVEARLEGAQRADREAESPLLIVAGEGFGARAAAYVIDVVVLYGLQILGAIGGAFFAGVMLAFIGRDYDFEQAMNGPEFVVIALLFSVLYFTFLEAWFGATVGKFILGMRVLKIDGRFCDLRSAFVRALFRVVEGLFFGIPAGISMKSPLQQRFGDRAAKTVVVNSRTTRIPNPRSRWRLLLAIGLYLILVMGTIGMVFFIDIAATAGEALDLSGVVLGPEDFTPGFQEFPLDELGFSPGESIAGNEIESVFGVMSFEASEFVWGFSVSLSTMFDQTRFDAELDDEDLLADSLIEGMGTVGTPEQVEFFDLGAVGDASAGLTMVARSQGVSMRLDMAIFRRGGAGVFVYAMYVDGEAPSVPTVEICRMLDERILEAISSGD